MASTEVCPQAFVSGIHTGVQFHPEVSWAIVRRWVEEAAGAGTLAPSVAEELRAGFDAEGGGPQAQVDLLFDSFLQRSGCLG